METDFTYTFRFTQEQVNQFAELSGDKNPIHISADYAKKTIFKKPIIHGYLGTSVFSKVFGTLFPGEGTIYLKQDLKFLAPMFVEQEYQAVFQVEETIKEKTRAVVKTEIFNSNGDKIVTGQALIQHPNYA